MRACAAILVPLTILSFGALSCSDSGVQHAQGSSGGGYAGPQSGGSTGGASSANTGAGNSSGGSTSSSNTTGGATASGNTGNTPEGTSDVGSSGTCTGWASRFWDCCKPHCAWSANVAGGSPMKTCSSSDALLSNPEERSACDSGGAYVCHDMAPWAVSSNLAYGYVATGDSNVCGRCFQLDFTNSGHDGANNPGIGALAGKTMIVQAVNMGGDVGSGQFDLMIPGGGVGQFNACSSQWGVSTDELGAQYGGFMTACQQELGYSASHDAYKSCVSGKCSSVFGSRGLSELEAGCQWYVEWFEVADNPNLNYKEVTCPSELSSLSDLNGVSPNGSCR